MEPQLFTYIAKVNVALLLFYLLYIAIFRRDTFIRFRRVYLLSAIVFALVYSFFSVDASNDPYWQDKKKIENGRPFFKKYIPIIKQISAAGWQPVTSATCNVATVRVERFGDGGNLYFTVRNNGNQDVKCIITPDLPELKLTGKFSATEMVSTQPVKIENNKLYLNIPAQRTQVIQITK